MGLIRRLLNVVRRDGWDRLTGRYGPRQEAIRREREARELRFERRQIKWLRDKVRRKEAEERKNLGNAKNIARAMAALPDEKELLEATATSVQIEEEAKRPALPPDPEIMRKWGKPEWARSEEDMRAFKAGASRKAHEQLAAMDADSPDTPKVVKVELSEELEKLVRQHRVERHLAKLEESPVQDKSLMARVGDKVPQGLKNLVVGKPKGRAKNPLERGGFTPTPDEYVDEIVPGYVDTPEAEERWRELCRAEKAFKKACEQREARPGPAVCQGVGLLEKGHVWWKVPRQAEYECVECGRNVPVMYFDLRRGTLVDIRNGMMTRETRLGLAMLAEGEGARLLGDGNPEEATKRLFEALRDDAGPNVGSLPYEVEKYAKRGGGAIDVRPDDAEWVELEGEYDVCSNCGMSKASHRDVALRRASAVIGGGEKVIHKLYCPRHGRDAT